MKILISESLLRESPKILSQPMSQSQMASKYPNFNYNISRGILMSLPVAIITGLDPTPADWVDDSGENREFTKGNRIPQDKPIEVMFDWNGEDPNDPNSYDFTLYDGNHRITQAKVNGDSHILALVDPNGNYGKLLKFYGR